MYKNIKKSTSILAMLLTSIYTVSAAEILAPLSNLVNSIGNILSVNVSAVLFSLATLTFFAVVIRFIWKRKNGDGKGLEQAKDMLWWTIIGLFVMFSVWGIILFLQNNIFGGAAATSIGKPQTTWTAGGNGNNSASSCSDGTIYNGVCYPNP